MGCSDCIFCAKFSLVADFPKTPVRNPSVFLSKHLLHTEKSAEVLQNPFPQKIVSVPPSPQWRGGGTAFGI